MARCGSESVEQLFGFLKANYLDVVQFLTTHDFADSEFINNNRAAILVMISKENTNELPIAVDLVQNILAYKQQVTGELDNTTKKVLLDYITEEIKLILSPKEPEMNEVRFPAPNSSFSTYANHSIFEKCLNALDHSEIKTKFSRFKMANDRLEKNEGEVIKKLNRLNELLTKVAITMPIKQCS